MLVPLNSPINATPHGSHSHHTDAPLRLASPFRPLGFHPFGLQQAVVSASGFLFDLVVGPSEVVMSTSQVAMSAFGCPVPATR
jgi:hypothetical protein